MRVLYSADGHTDELVNFYYCPKCNIIKYKGIEKVISHYCPNCLFDVPSLSLTQDIGRCTRSCLCCPHCDVTLSIFKNRLVCCYCGYQNLDYEKSTGIGSKILQSINKMPFIETFNAQKQYFKDIHSFKSKPSRHKLAKGHPIDTLECKFNSLSASDDDRIVMLLRQQLTSSDQLNNFLPNCEQSVEMIASPILNSINNTNNYLPQRVQLQSKCDVYCSCNFRLLKNEPKINQTAPLETYCANQYLPRGLIYKSNDSIAIIRLANTQSTPIKLKLSHNSIVKDINLAPVPIDLSIPSDPVPNAISNDFQVLFIKDFWVWLQIPLSASITISIEFKYEEETEYRLLDFNLAIEK